MTDETRRSSAPALREVDQGIGHTTSRTEPAHERNVQEHEESRGTPDKTVETGDRRSHARVSPEERRQTPAPERRNRQEADDRDD